MLSKPFKKNVSYESLFENSNSIMLIIEPETGHIFDANRAALKFYQYSKKELLSLNISQINDFSSKQIKQELLDAKLEKRNYFNFRHKLKSGKIKEVEVHSNPIKFDGKDVLYSVIHDISEKKWTQDALKESESTIRAMINATNSMVYLSDFEGNIINLNTSGAQLFDKNPEEMIGKNFNIFFNKNDFSRLTLLVNDVKKTHKPINYQKERNKKFYDVNLYPVFNKNNQVDRICIFANDITDIKKTEKAFAAIETAGGICHDMNQPLQVILGNLELLKMSTQKDDPNINFIDIILSQVEKLGSITKKLTHITRYETKEYMKGTIFDIDRSSKTK